MAQTANISTRQDAGHTPVAPPPTMDALRDFAETLVSRCEGRDGAQARDVTLFLTSADVDTLCALARLLKRLAPFRTQILSLVNRGRA